MDEQRIYELLSSGNTNQENEGLKMLSEHKVYLLRKHRIPNHFNQDDRDGIFYKGIMVLFDRIKEERFILGKASIERFIFGTFRNIILRMIRDRSEIPTEDMTQINVITDKSNIFNKEILEQISQIFRKKLGETCQKVLIMRFYEGMRLKEIAAEMNFTLGTIRNNSSQCMDKLKKLIDENPNLKNYLKGLLED